MGKTVVLTCGYNGGETLLCKHGKNLPPPLFLAPEAPYWASLVCDWSFNLTEAQITWKNIFLTKKEKNSPTIAALEDVADRPASLMAGDNSEFDKILLQPGVVCRVATAGVSTFFVTSIRSFSDNGTAMVRGIYTFSGTKSKCSQIRHHHKSAAQEFYLLGFTYHIHMKGFEKLCGPSSTVVRLHRCLMSCLKITLGENSADCVTVPQLADVKMLDLVAGREHVLFLTLDGKIFSLGLSSRGQLGHGNLDAAEVPVLITAFDGIVIKQVAAGGWTSMALTDQGLVFVWGWNSAGALGFPNRACREQPGYMPKHGADPAAEMVELLAEPTNLPLLEKISSISCGERHAGAVSVTGKVFLWGLNQHGQLGLGDTTNRDYPVLLNTLAIRDLHVSRLFCGEWATVLLLPASLEDTNNGQDRLESSN
ncbi:putative RCC1 domain-containing protein 1 [Hypsibius exemplaris]|uniref:RCC1 domain-containing protein 1 n=1 Tax=Hypsibius exemplaris TaxID=2072580 RepID=A0A1W0WI84_HYPEX|nr:putative RCC1 domain-containing protein 1 [Hypsibius exemplaris]